MIRLIAVAFALTLASSAQALPPVVSLNQPDQLVIPVREACGAGMHMVNGKCVNTHARRAASRRPRSDLLSHGTSRTPGLDTREGEVGDGLMTDTFGSASKRWPDVGYWHKADIA